MRCLLRFPGPSPEVDDVFELQQMSHCDPPDLMLLVPILEVNVHSLRIWWSAHQELCIRGPHVSPRSAARVFEECRRRLVLWFLFLRRGRHLRQVEAPTTGDWWFGR